MPPNAFRYYAYYACRARRGLGALGTDEVTAFQELKPDTSLAGARI